MNTEIFTVGNVAFTSEGVQVCIPYSQSSEAPARPLTYEDLRPRMVAYCNRRMRRCAENLGQNLASAKEVTPEIVSWKGGHFSVPVYKVLKEFVDHRGDKKYFNALILQQIIREYAVDRYIGESQLDADVYKYLNASKSIDYYAFFGAITEMMLVCCDNERLMGSIEAMGCLYSDGVKC